MMRWLCVGVVLLALVCVGCGSDDSGPANGDAQTTTDIEVDRDLADAGDAPPPCKEGRIGIDLPDSPLGADNVVFFGSLVPQGAAQAQRILLRNNATNACELDVTRLTSVLTSSQAGLIEILDDGEPLSDDYTATLEPDGLLQFDVVLRSDLATSADPGCTELRVVDVPEACRSTYNSAMFDNYRATACGGVFVETTDPDVPCAISLISVLRGGGSLEVLGALNDNRRITFQSALSGEPAQREDITLRNIGSTELRIEWDISQLDLETEFAIEPQTATLVPGGEQGFTLTYTPLSTDAMMSPDRGNLVLSTNDSENPLIAFAVRVGDPDAAQLNVSPTTLDFSGVAMGDSRTESITINNGGILNPLAVNLTLSPSTAMTDYTFQCRDSAAATPANCPAPLVVPAGEDRFVDVTYSPSSATPLDARLVVSASGNMSADVALEATGSLGTLAANPTSLTFRNVTAGQSEFLQVTLQNASTNAVNVTAVNQSGSDCDRFDVALQNQAAMLPASVQASGNLAFDVVYTRPASDTTGTAASCDFVFVNDGATPMLSVSAQYTP